MPSGAMDFSTTAMFASAKYRKCSGNMRAPTRQTVWTATNITAMPPSGLSRIQSAIFMLSGRALRAATALLICSD